jgi:hypothetical protein
MTFREFVLRAERHKDWLKREDRRAGVIVAALYNLNARTSETDPVQNWDDFFIEWKEPTKEQTEEKMLQAMMLFAKSTNEGLKP